jgi:hypothetical protein
MMDVVRGTKVGIVFHNFKYHSWPVCKDKFVKTYRSGLVRVASQRSKAFVASGTWSCGERARAFNIFDNLSEICFILYCSIWS